MFVMTDFWNRQDERSHLKRVAGAGQFGLVTGRRRVGKTALLKKACEEVGGLYHQAIEGTPPQQLAHLAGEIGDHLGLLKEVTPKTWDEFFKLLSREKLPGLLVFDEFPYWTRADPTLPSLLQKWIDHELRRRKTSLVVSGSSQSMLYSEILNGSAPLYGRASLHLHLQPLSYKWFCRVFGYPVSKASSFERYALVGGVPHYWKIMPKASIVAQTDTLYFESSAILSEEPAHWLRDEEISGSLSKGILDLVGRGVSKPSELAARLGTPQGNLSRPMAMLLELGLIHRELPFGESTRTTKKVLYTIRDAALAFYYGTYLQCRTRWGSLSRREKEGLLSQHASRQWEIFCRQAFPESGRYWEGDVELDLVAFDRKKSSHLVAECKWRKLSVAAEKTLLLDLQEKFRRTQLAKKLGTVSFAVFSKKNLSFIAELQNN